MRAATARSLPAATFASAKPNAAGAGVVRIALVETSSRSFGAVAQLLHVEEGMFVVSREAQMESAIERARDLDVIVLVADDQSALERALLQRDDHTDVRVVAVSEAVRAPALAALLRAGLKAVVTPSKLEMQLVSTINAVAAGLVALPDALMQEALPHAPRTSDVQPAALSPREREILALVADGLGNKSVAAKLGISEHTVKTHVASIFEKLGAETRAEAVAIGVRSGTILL